MNDTKIRPNVLRFTVLARDAGKKIFIFQWDFFHWLRFDSEGKFTDIRYVGTAETYQRAREICQEKYPNREIVTKYCPRSCGWY